MASENETVMDVCAEWRDCIESADPSVWNDERIAGLVKTTKAQQLAYLDRIEAAIERDRTSRHSIKIPIEVVPELAGNAAAMREALSDACYAMFNFLKTQSGGYEEMAIALDKAKHALSAPARNCDAYKTPDDCMRAFESYVREHGKLGFINPFTEVVKWLLAPAAEQKEGVE